MAQGDVHVTYRDSEDKWAVEVEGNSRASSLHDTKPPAEQEARMKAQESQAVLLVHRKDGEVQERRAYGPDARRFRLARDRRVWLIAIVTVAVLVGFFTGRAWLRD